METFAAYLARKHEELSLLSQCLGKPLPLTPPSSVADVIRCKFQLTAALKAQFALEDWAGTETAWAQGPIRSGPFQFSYDYQRADLNVQGPSFYELDDQDPVDVIYTASGMAAISSLLLALVRMINRGHILLLPGSYSETQEFVDRYTPDLRKTMLSGPLAEADVPHASFRILLVDSSAPADTFEAVLESPSRAFDLVIFDTTCFAAISSRIRRVLRWAAGSDVPMVMVRSHTKLDSLGGEYGRLGSAVFVDWRKVRSSLRCSLETLPGEMRNAVRLLGGAALPAHFPPYIGCPAYRELTTRRMAAILWNGRRASRYFASALPGLTDQLRFAHGLYMTLRATKPLDEAGARRAAADMSRDLGASGLPIRHAGSFGFDFAATEWFHDQTTGHYSVRVAVPDLPTRCWIDVIEAIARWWLTHQIERNPRAEVRP